MATEADKIFEALSNKFTGEVNAKEFIDKVFFGENSEYLNEFHDKFKKELFNPVKNRLGVVFKMIQRRLDSIKPDTIDYITDPFDNLKKFSNDVNNKTEEWLAALDEKYKKLLEKDEATPTTPNKPTPIEMASVSSTKAVEVLPSKIQQATTKTETKPIKQQAGFDPQVQLVEFDGKTEGFFKSLFNKFKIDDKTKKVAQDSTSGGFSYGGILGDGIQILLAGLAGLVGAFMTNGPMKGTLELIGKGGLRGGLALLSKTLFKDFAKTALKKVPIIGALYSYSLAWQRLNSGDTIGGILDIASGTASLFPGVGTAISIGIDVLQAILDAKSGGSSAEASGKKLKILGDWGKKLGDYLYKVPFIKNIVDFGSGMELILEGLGIIGNPDSKKIKDGAKLMSNLPILGVFPALVADLLDAEVTNDQGQVVGFDTKKFVKNFRDHVKSTVLKWIPNPFGLRNMYAKQALGMSDAEISRLDGEVDESARTVVMGTAMGALLGNPILGLQAGQDINKLGNIPIPKFDKKNYDKKIIEQKEKELEEYKNGKYSKLKENILKKVFPWKDIYKQNVEILEKEIKDLKEKEKDKQKINENDLKSSHFKTDNNPSQSILNNKNSIIPNDNDNQKSLSKKSEIDIDDRESLSKNDEIDIEDEVFSIKDNKGTRYIPDKNDTLVVSKPDGALNKTLLEIKQVMIGVHKSIRELPKNQSNPSVMPVNVNNTSNSTGGEISSRDSIFNMRSEYWFKTPPIGRVTV